MSFPVDYIADPGRYDEMHYRRCGRSGLRLPVISLGLWHNFGDDRPWETQRAICRRAFDKGITHFLDQSLTRLGLDYVDIFYSHRVDPDTPMEKTAGALASAVPSHPSPRAR